MYIGEVVGCVVASVKEERLGNIPLPGGPPPAPCGGAGPDSCYAP